MIRKIIVAGAIMLLLATAGLPVQAQESSVLIQESKVVRQPVSETLTVYGQVQADPDAVLTISLPHAGSNLEPFYQIIINPWVACVCDFCRLC